MVELEQEVYEMLRKVGVALMVLGSAAGAQAEGREPLVKSFAEVAGWVTKGAEMVPVDKYSYRPVGTVRTFGELVGHIADGMNWYCANAVGRKVEWSTVIEKGKTDKATVTAALKQAVDACTAATRSGRLEEVIGNISHTSLHYGNMIMYLRMLGMVPPSS